MKWHKEELLASMTREIKHSKAFNSFWLQINTFTDVYLKFSGMLCSKSNYNFGSQINSSRHGEYVL